MKVKITDCRGGRAYSWYINHIGKEFKVWEDRIDPWYEDFMVKTEEGEIRTLFNCAIWKEDCEVIEQ